SGNTLVLARGLTPETGPSYTIPILARDLAGHSFAKNPMVVVKSEGTIEGTAGDDVSTYRGSLTSTRFDGLEGTATLQMPVAKVAVQAIGTDVGIDIDANGTINFLTANVENLVLSGTQSAQIANLSSTALAAGGIAITGTSGGDILDASKAGVRVVL